MKSPMRREKTDKDWTKGSIIGNLLSLGWPVMIGGSLDMLGTTIDMIWIGRLGPASIAGVGISGMVVMLLHSMLMGLYVGMRAMVARFIGAGDKKGAIHTVQQSFIINIVYSLTIALIGIYYAEEILILLGVSSDVVSEGVPYLQIHFLGMITMSFRRTTESTMQASGDTKTPMYIAVVYRILHVALCPVLVFGLWIFPHMGVTGAALTNVFSQGFGGALGLWFLFSGRTRIKLTMKNFRVDPTHIWRIIKLALPASISGMERSLGNLILMWFMTPFGTLAVAAHTLNQRLDMFLNVPSRGFGQTAGVLTGQNLGAGKIKRAENTGWIAAGFLSSVMVVISTAAAVWAAGIVRIFTSDPELLQLGVYFLRIAAIGYVLMSFNMTMQQCITGAGDTFPPMVIMLFNMWLIQVPLAFVLPRIGGIGVYGVRWAIVGGTTTAAISHVVYFASGRWKKKVV